MKPPMPGAGNGLGDPLQLAAFPVGHFSLKTLHLHFHPFYVHDLDLGAHKDASRLQEPSWGGGAMKVGSPSLGGTEAYEDTANVRCVWKPPLAG